jgi:hypothetical protein
MKKTSDSGSDMRKEYDFRPGVRGKYTSRFVEGSKAVLLEPDVAAVFPDSASVNQALRRLIGESTPSPKKDQGG